MGSYLMLFQDLWAQPCRDIISKKQATFLQRGPTKFLIFVSNDIVFISYSQITNARKEPCQTLWKADSNTALAIQLLKFWNSASW